jgi:hypothetical protein
LFLVCAVPSPSLFWCFELFRTSTQDTYMSHMYIYTYTHDTTSRIMAYNNYAILKPHPLHRSNHCT